MSERTNRSKPLIGRPLKRPLAMALVVLTASATGACGAASRGHTASSATSHAGQENSSAAPTTATTPAASDRDKDNDFEAASDDTVNNTVAHFGHPASPSDRHAIVALIHRYYQTALREDGAAACSMLYSTLEESVPEDYGSYAGPKYMRGTTCPTALTALFRHFHRLLEIELPKLEVRRVGLEAHHGVLLLSFGALPEREISVAREGHIWRMSALLDSEVP